MTREFTTQGEANRKEVAEWVESTPNAVCYSSHTAVLPPPEVDNVSVFPIIFVRHPIDRIASAYEFEKKQSQETILVQYLLDLQRWLVI